MLRPSSTCDHSRNTAKQTTHRRTSDSSHRCSFCNASLTMPGSSATANGTSGLDASAPFLGEATEAYKGRDEVAYALSRVPLGTRRPIKVIVVGAGFSGLAMAREVETGHLQQVDLTVYEKNASVGGTWYENRYPGYAIACTSNHPLPL